MGVDLDGVDPGGLGRGGGRAEHGVDIVGTVDGTVVTQDGNRAGGLARERANVDGVGRGGRCVDGLELAGLETVDFTRWVGLLGHGGECD